MKNTNNTLAAVQLNQVIEQLNSLADWQLINIYTDYADENRYADIHDLTQDTINDLFESPWDAITKSNHDGFNENDSYFVFNGYGLMSTFTSLDSDNSPIDIEELAEWLISEDKLADYDITVTTLDDKYNIILDHINDIDSVSSIQSLLSYLSVDFIYTNEWLSLSENNTIDNYIEKYINAIVVHFIDKKDNDQLDDLLEYFNVEL